MSANIADVVIHIDENLSSEQRETIEESLRALDGVVSVKNSDKASHLTIVAYNSDNINSKEILKRITDQGAHAELIGL